MNLREMFGLRVPIISVVIGEGGSGGALAIGCSNWNLIMEHSVYYVASPEACAAILWKSRDKAATVSSRMHDHLLLEPMVLHTAESCAQSVCMGSMRAASDNTGFPVLMHILLSSSRAAG